MVSSKGDVTFYRTLDVLLPKAVGIDQLATLAISFESIQQVGELITFVGEQLLACICLQRLSVISWCVFL